MSIFFRRQTKVARRIDSIEDELSDISGRIRALSKDVERQGEAAVQRAGRGLKETGSTAQTRPVVPPPGRTPGVSSAASGASGPEPRTSRGGGRGAAAVKPVQREDEQFASYFMSGGLKREVVEPLRRERSIQRRKALFLLLCLVILVFALLFFRFWG
ncbi:MAG: hypothetical protein WCL44_07295 [bacterium]